MAVKEEGKASAELQQASKPSQANLVFQAWLARHFHLLETQGLLNLAPEGCNPEAAGSRGPGVQIATALRR